MVKEPRADAYAASATVRSDRANLFDLREIGGYHMMTLVSGSVTQVERFDRDVARIVHALAFIDRMAQFTTPEDDFEDLRSSHSDCPADMPYDDVDEMISDMDDERLCNEYATFMDMVREARKIRDGRDVDAPRPAPPTPPPVYEEPSPMSETMGMRIFLMALATTAGGLIAALLGWI